MNNDLPDPNPSNHPDKPKATGGSRLIATAFHEAGHAVMAMSVGRQVGKVTIRPGKSQLGDQRLGSCEIKKGQGKGSKDALDEQVLILFAGMVAEARFTGQYCRQGAAQDLNAIRRMLSQRARSEKQLERLQNRMLDRAENIMDEKGNAKAIELIARELIEKQTISGRAVRHFFEQANRET